jgi:hypothetical protein
MTGPPPAPAHSRIGKYAAEPAISLSKALGMMEDADFRRLFGDLQEGFAALRKRVNVRQRAVTRILENLNEALAHASGEAWSELAAPNKRRRRGKRAEQLLREAMLSELRELLPDVRGAEPHARIEFTEIETIWVIQETQRSFEQHTNDVQSNRFVASLWLGGAVTLIGNWITATPTAVSLISLVALLAVLCEGGLWFFRASQAQQRADACREQILEIAAKAKKKPRKRRPSKRPQPTV